MYKSFFVHIFVKDVSNAMSQYPNGNNGRQRVSFFKPGVRIHVSAAAATAAVFK